VEKSQTSDKTVLAQILDYTCCNSIGYLYGVLFYAFFGSLFQRRRLIRINETRLTPNGSNGIDPKVDQFMEEMIHPFHVISENVISQVTLVVEGVMNLGNRINELNGPNDLNDLNGFNELNVLNGLNDPNEVNDPND
jgi:hypothetical protein